jgi:hypothetical protein
VSTILKTFESFLLLIILAGSAACVDNALTTKNHMSVEETLKRIRSASDVPPDLQITYDDMHGLWGGTTIIITGKGDGERRERDRGRAEPKTFNKTITPEQMLELVNLLIEHKAWEQRTPDRAPLADESRASLRIQVSGQSSSIWEWFNDMEKTKRLSIIKAKMKQLTS